MRFAATILIAASIQLAAVAPAGASDPEGRWVDFGKWNGVVDCESSPNASARALVTPFGVPLAPSATTEAAREVRVDQAGSARDRGAFQFIPSTWDSVARLRGKPHLIGDDPRTKTLAQQLRQAEWLRRHDGIGHWTCGYRYGDGTGPRWVTGEIRTPKNPERCARNLRRHWGRSRSVARTVCGVGG